MTTIKAIDKALHWLVGWRVPWAEQTHVFLHGGAFELAEWKRRRAGDLAAAKI